MAVDNTCTYVLYKGCDQTWDTCGANNAWGPSANNQANFAGCLHIAVPTYPQDAITESAPTTSTPPPETFGEWVEAYEDWGEGLEEPYGGYEEPDYGI